MTDRKYKQRGYQDDDRGRERERSHAPRPPQEKYDPRIPRDPKASNMMGFREAFRCARCGRENDAAIGSLSRCEKCATALRACIQCASFESSAVYECTQKIPVRVSPKDETNDCAHFSPRMKIEKETHSTPAPSSDRGGYSSPSDAARKAFDDLFRK